MLMQEINANQNYISFLAAGLNRRQGCSNGKISKKG
jgi:hypothetical protein